MGEEHAVEDVILTSATNCISNKVHRVTTRRRASIQRNQPSCPAMSIAEFLDQQKQQGSIQLLEGSHSMQHEEGQRSNVEHICGFEQENEEETNEEPTGPTLLSDVHARKLEDRVPIFFNEHGHPIGPTEKACDEFSKFLGTIAHEHLWAPLIYTNWHKVPDKDKMWGYVNYKYMLPQTDCVKKWVLESIACAWRLFKCRLKANHYYKYDNDAERWKHRPSRIPDSHFKLLLQYWNTSTAKASRDGQPPSKRMMFEETRKRKDGLFKPSCLLNIIPSVTEHYANAHSTIHLLQMQEKMKELEVLHETGLSDSDTDPFDRVMGSIQNGRVQLYGRGVSMKNLKEKGLEVKRDGKSVVVPEQYVDAIRSSLATKMQKDFEAEKEKLALNMKQEFEAQKDKMVEDVITKAFARLREMFPDMATDMLEQAVISSILADH
ncbi:hypothetical protein Cgig2_029601 [Carnegiea gigantea]|uniref:Transposase, Ptta/En/Spm, plant n=1 Tax=Carnegiea gigantea TaxID=171969 RepID=A0A9Q1Q6C0_9CARY|nr:hypothetical protein Cgig2_029601 [Carnegiea gigantea]